MDQRFNEIAEREANFLNLQRQAQLTSKADETIKAVDKAKFPTAAKIAAKNPTWVKERILEGIEMARAKNFDMTVEEALTGLESHWANFTSFVSDPVTAAPTAAAAPLSATPVVPSEAPTQKQPPRPIRSKWDRADDETSRRTNEVLKEYFVRNSTR
jgi:predicted DNA-binding transcriptional regulator AlpA